MSMFKKIALGTALAATALGASAPASAQGYYGRHHGDDATAAVVGGVIGLALGAAIASSNHRGYDDYNYNYRNGGWYEGYQYNNGGFYDRQGHRRYDRNSWRHRHHDGDRRGSYQRGYDGRDGYGDRDGYRGQYGNGYSQYDQGGYTGGYNRGY